MKPVYVDRAIYEGGDQMRSMRVSKKSGWRLSARSALSQSLFHALAFLIGMGLASASHAFKLRPFASEAENRIRFLEASRLTSIFDATTSRIVDHFSNPVHEEITHRIFGCAETPDKSCVEPQPLGKYSPKAVLFGVQWNDNPPFQVQATGFSDCPANTTIRLPNFASCWVKLFKDAEKNAPSEYFDYSTDHALIYRVHFGDMQFLHSMASWDGESTRDTKTKVMAWAELMYKTSIGEIDPGIKLNATNIEEIRNTFSRNGWTVVGLLTLGQDVTTVRSVGDVAFGSLLHMIEDSFALGHVERDNATAGTCAGFDGLRKAGDIREFHSYANQDKDIHGEKDSRNLMEAHLLGAMPTVVDIGRALVSMREKKMPWSGAQNYFDQCVFPVAPDYVRHPAGPGADFRKR